MNPIDMNEIRKDDTFWIEIKNYLSQLEQLSVGTESAFTILILPTISAEVFL